jgi:predicted DNA binding CopG/RHH family protein
MNTDESPPDYRDPHTGLTPEELKAAADEAEAQADDPEAWEPVEVEIDPDPRSVFAVRLNRAEVRAISKAAAAAGVPMSRFIRDAAVAAANSDSAVDTARIHDAVATAIESLAVEMAKAITEVARRAVTETGRPRKAAAWETRRPRKAAAGAARRTGKTA